MNKVLEARRLAEVMQLAYKLPAELERLALAAIAEYRKEHESAVETFGRLMQMVDLALQTYGGTAEPAAWLRPDGSVSTHPAVAELAGYVPLYARRDAAVDVGYWTPERKMAALRHFGLLGDAPRAAVRQQKEERTAEPQTFSSYVAHEASRKLSPCSPEAHEAEVAWNAALRRMKFLISAAHSAGLDDWCDTLLAEADNLDTGA